MQKVLYPSLEPLLHQEVALLFYSLVAQTVDSLANPSVNHHQLPWHQQQQDPCYVIDNKEAQYDTS